MAHYYRFHVRLRDVRPPIWRRFLLPASASFAALHEAIRDYCGWWGEHRYAFLRGGRGYAEIPAAGGGDGWPAWSATPLASWFGERGNAKRKCVYWYDFGDDWMHEVELEGLEEHAASYGRRLLDGARAFPPEDAGGIPGYERCLAVWKNTHSGAAPAGERDAEDRELLEWLGDWDPERFDLDALRRRFDSPLTPPPGCPRSIHDEDLADPPGLREPTSGPAYNLARHLSRIVRAASLHPPGEIVMTGLPCMRRPNHRPCRGRMIVVRLEGEGDVDYQCAVCADGGSVSGWRGGQDDLTDLATPEDAADDAAYDDELAVRIPTEIYAALLDDRLSAPASERLLYSARASAGQVELRGDITELEVLHDEALAEADQAPRGVFKKRLRAACELLYSTIVPGAGE